MRVAPHAIQRCEADAEIHFTPIAIARNVSVGTGIAPAGLSWLAWRSGVLQFSAGASGRIEKATGDPSAIADGEGFDRARNETRQGTWRVARGNPRAATGGRIENAAPGQGLG